MVRKPHHIYCEMYGVNIYLYQAIPPEEVSVSIEIHLANTYAKEGLEGANGKAIEFWNGDYVIWVKGSGKKYISALAHECLHITNMILNNRGVGITLDNDEAQAYLMEFIFKKCLEAKRQCRRIIGEDNGTRDNERRRKD